MAHGDETQIEVVVQFARMQRVASGRVERERRAILARGSEPGIVLAEGDP